MVNGELMFNGYKISVMQNECILEMHLPALPVANSTMAPHSSTHAWKIPWTEEPGRRQSMGSLRVSHD